MALSDNERAFWEAASAEGHSDEEIAATLKRRRGTAPAPSTAAPPHVAQSEVAAGPRPRQMPWDNPDETTASVPLRDRVAAGALKDDVNYLPKQGEGRFAGIKRFAQDLQNVTATSINSVSAGAFDAFNRALGIPNQLKTRAETAQRQPGVMNAAGYAGLMAGAGPALAKATTRGVTAAAEELPAAVRGLGRLVGSAGAGAVSSAVPAGLTAAGAGKSADEVFREVLAAGKTGAEFGAGGQLLAEGAGAVGRGLRATRAGQARTFTEQNQGNVTLRGGQQGIPELEGIAPTRRNIGEVKRQSGKDISAGLQSEFERRFGQTYRAARAEAEAPVGPNGMSHADLPVDLTPMHNRIAQVAYSEKTPVHVAGYLKTELDKLDARGWKASWRELEDMKQRYQNDVTRGVPGGPGTGNVREQALEAVANAATELSQQGPYGRANAIYHQGMEELRHDRALMGLKPKPGDVQIGEKAIGRWVGRRGEDTDTAGLHAPAATHAEFAARHPELTRALDMPDLLRAKGDLQFGLPNSENLIAATARGHGAIGQLAHIGAHNLGALGARGLHLVEPLAQPPALTNQLVAAAQQKRLEDRYTIESIFGRKNTEQQAPQPGQ